MVHHLALLQNDKSNFSTKLHFSVGPTVLYRLPT